MSVIIKREQEELVFCLRFSFIYSNWETRLKSANSNSIFIRKKRV